MTFKFSIIPPDLDQSIKKKIADTIEKDTIRAVNGSLLEIKGGMTEVSPVGLGTLKGSWLVVSARKIGKTIQGLVLSKAIQATIVDEGAVPHTPPSSALRPWVRRTLGITDEKGIFVATRGLQRKIAREGIKGKHTFTKKFEELEPRILANMKAAQNRTVTIINRLIG